MTPYRTEIHSIRLASGEEALVARVTGPGGRIGLGFSLRLDATEARHMAEWAAGARRERPPYEAPIPSDVEKALIELGWLPTA